MDDSLAEWLADHEIECRGRVRKWLANSWAVPVPLLRMLWPDPTWRLMLSGTVVGTRADPLHGSPVTIAGLLEEVGADGVAVRGLDGGARRIEVDALVFAHPADIPDRDVVREVAAEHDLTDSTGQLALKGRPWAPHRYNLRSTYDWVRDLRLRSGLASVGPETAEGLDAPGYPKEQAVRVRTYRHPDLGDRPVISLLTDTAGAGADLLAAHLGCAAPEIGPPVSAARRDPLLGYPAWALVNDPGADTLEGLQVLRAARRRSPGDPRGAFDLLRRHVETSLPAAHAPAFWVEAAAAFDSTGAASRTEQDEYSARCFRMSREACPRSLLTADPDLWCALARVYRASIEEACARWRNAMVRPPPCRRTGRSRSPAGKRRIPSGRPAGTRRPRAARVSTATSATWPPASATAARPLPFPTRS
jgi:hypothetical protein